MNIARVISILAGDEARDQGTIVSMICTAGWHGEPCDAAREQSASKLPCDCTCHKVKR